MLTQINIGATARHEPGRGWLGFHRAMLVACVCGLPALAGAATDPPGATEAMVTTPQADPAPATAGPATRALRHRAARPARTSRLEARVQLLTVQLGLDARQQAGVRRILESQREQVMRVWKEGSVPPDDRVSTTRAIAERSMSQIRALLNDSQKAEYLHATVPQESRPSAAPAAAEDRTPAPDSK